MKNTEIENEILRLKELFKHAEDSKLEAMSGLIEQAAHISYNLKKLNAIAMKTGLIEVHPENTSLQRALPISNEITKHTATLNSLMNSLMRHLNADTDDWMDGLDEYN